MSTASNELYDCLEQFFQRVFSLAESDAMDRLVELDVSFSQARTVFLLAHCTGDVPINEIASKLGLSVAAAGRNVEQLVKLGVAERRENPDDRRVKLITLTPEGLKIADQHIEQKRSTVRSFVDRLPTPEAESLTRALRPILAGDYLRSSTKDHHVSS